MFTIGESRAISHDSTAVELPLNRCQKSNDTYERGVLKYDPRGQPDTQSLTISLNVAVDV